MTRLRQYAAWILAVLLLMLPVPAAAGAWLRETGTGYLSYALTLEDAAARDPAGYATLYGEYGLHPDLTLGLDAGSDEDGKSKVLAFGVTRLNAPGAALKLAAELGLGAIDGRPVLRPGLSVGHGLTLFDRPGWISLESRIGLQIDGGQHFLANDLTIGMVTGPGHRLMVQLQQGGPLNDSDYLRLVPSMILQQAPGRHIEIGLTAGLKSASDVGLKLAFWRSF